MNFCQLINVDTSVINLLCFKVHENLYYSGIALPLMSPITKYTGMINSAVPYNYPGKHCCWSFYSILVVSESSEYFSHLLQLLLSQILMLLFLTVPMQSLCGMMETCLMSPPIRVIQKETTWSGLKSYNFTLSQSMLVLFLLFICVRKSAPQ